MDEKKRIRRISVFGGPGSGKSTIAHYLFARLKMLHYNVEFVSEYVKTWTFLDQQPQSFDQVKILSEQIYAEDIILRKGINLVMTECPCFLTLVYSNIYTPELSPPIYELASAFEEKYPSLNIVLARDVVPYHQVNRWQTYEQAIKVDNLLLRTLDNYKVNNRVFNTNDYVSMEEYIVENLNPQDKLK